MRNGVWRSGRSILMGLMLAVAALLPAGAAQAQGAEGDILAQLRALPGVQVIREGFTPVPGARIFLLTLEQPADHTRPDGPRFAQRLTLLHRSASAPMVLATSGYGLSGYSGLTELEALLGANRINVEHRFFGPSRPADNDHRLLTVAQSAADSHRIVQTFKALYPGRWANTGGSKGGMTALYHRYLYPEDVDATVPYVAPNSYGPSDNRYVRFVDTVGDAACRARLADFQRLALERRERLVALFPLAYGPLPFEHLGADRALEFAVLETPFTFWQYVPAEFCAEVPGAEADDWTVLDFLENVAGLSVFSDAGVGPTGFYGAYFYQAATELGAPRVAENHLHGLVRYPGQDVPSAGASAEVSSFDHALMHHVATWVRQHGQRLLFVYGENDPWSTNAFQVHPKNDALVLFVPRGTHGNSSLMRLPPAERRLALERLGGWMGVDLSRFYPAAGAALARSAAASEEWAPYDVEASSRRALPR